MCCKCKKERKKDLLPSSQRGELTYNIQTCMQKAVLFSRRRFLHSINFLAIMNYKYSLTMLQNRKNVTKNAFLLFCYTFF